MSGPGDILGARFGRLEVIGTGASRGGQKFWRARCECGGLHEATSNALRSGRVKSCGCLNQEMRLERNTKHGMAPRSGPRPEYWVWQAMIRRCVDPKNKSWSEYGGRGIAVCARWRDSFEIFLQDMGPRPAGMTGLRPTYSIDRVDNERGYEPGNCRWATTKQQAANRRSRWRSR